MFKGLSFLKILGIGFGALALFTLVCGALAIFLLEKFPNWTFNELVFPTGRR